MIFDRYTLVWDNLKWNAEVVLEANTLIRDGKIIDGFSTLIELVDDGNPIAMFYMAMHYYSHIGIVHNSGMVAEYMTAAAENGLGIAQYQLGEMYESGCYVNFDRELSNQWYIRAKTTLGEESKAGNPISMLLLGNIFGEGKATKTDPLRSYICCCKATKACNVDGHINVAICYIRGVGVEKDECKGLQMLSKIAKVGNARAQRNLGVCYNYGYGVVKDESKAVEWYEKSAEQGNADAQRALGNCYYNGSGVVKDESKAVEWYEKSAEQGNADAQYNLVNYYFNVQMGGIDSLAVHWLQKLAAQGDPDAQCDLGACYENGRGLARNESKAIEWYEKSAELGNPEAQHRLDLLIQRSRRSNGF
ncbi:MAG: sel1 repeat family protein [Paludibacteraceae bacterium]|nr:sel1 repeat family protein [Paludibacteraceae bacterium]